MIEVDAAQFSYPQFTLGPQTWSLAPGARCALVGANGAGKTTLLGLIGGQLVPSRGNVRIGGVSVADDPIAVRARVALVTERLLCCPWLSVGAHFRLQSRFFKDWNAPLATESAALLGVSLDAKLSTLSRGNSLKVALCSAFAQQATLLLLDEPTAGLDPVARSDFLNLLRREVSARPALTVIFATHILEDLDELKATDLVVLTNGAAEAIDVGATTHQESVAALARQSLLSPQRSTAHPQRLTRHL